MAAWEFRMRIGGFCWFCIDHAQPQTQDLSQTHTGCLLAVKFGVKFVHRKYSNSHYGIMARLAYLAAALCSVPYEYDQDLLRPREALLTNAAFNSWPGPAPGWKNY